MDRNQALQWVESELANDKLIKHVLAVEAIMRTLAAFGDKFFEIALEGVRNVSDQLGY